MPLHNRGDPKEAASLVFFYLQANGTLPADSEDAVTLQQVHLKLRVDRFHSGQQALAALFTEDLLFVFIM